MSLIGEHVAQHLALEDIEASLTTLSPDSTPIDDISQQLPKWLEHSNTVVDVRSYRDDEPTQFGTFSYHECSMSDGTVYHLVQGQPYEQKTAVPVDGGTPWGFQPDGISLLADQEFMRLGFPTRRIGPEIFPEARLNNPLGILLAIRKGFDVSLGYSAHNMLEILEASDGQNSAVITAGTSLVVGESRHAMIEPGLNALGRLRPHERIVAHADSVDPCDVSNALSLDYIKGVRILLTEGGAALRVGLQAILSADRAKLARSFDLSPKSSIPVATLLRALLGRQAVELAKMRPTDSPMHVTFMPKSHVNGRKALEAVYATHPLVHVDILPSGAHMDVLGVMPDVVSRHGRMLDQLQQNGDDPTSLDMETVYGIPRKRGKDHLTLVT